MKKFSLLLLLVFFASSASAELIYLKNGEVVRGKIIKITPVYVRIEKRIEDTRREFLVEDIERISQDPTLEDQISGLAIKNLYLKANNPTQKELRDAAMDKATELVQEALKHLQMGTLGEGAKGVEAAAQEKAAALIAEKIRQSNGEQLDQAPETVKSIAAEVANTLIEEAMKDAKVQQFAKLSQDMQVTAQGQIAVIVADAVKNAEEEVQKVVSEKVQALALEQVNQAAEEATKAKVAETVSETTIVPTSAPVAIEPAVSPEPVVVAESPALPKSAVPVSEPETNSIPAQAPSEVQPEEPVIIPANFQEAVKLTEEEQVVPQSPEKLDEPVAEESVPALEEKVQAIPEAVQEGEYEEEAEKGAGGFPIKMGWVIAIAVLVILPLFFRRKSLPEAKIMKEANKGDLQVTTSFIYSYLPEDLGAKLTQEDISLIVEYEFKIRKEHAAENPTKTQISEYIHEKIKDLMPLVTASDMEKILDIKEKFVK